MTYVLYSQFHADGHVHILATFEDEEKALSYAKMLDTLPNEVSYHVAPVDLHITGKLLK